MKTNLSGRQAHQDPAISGPVIVFTAAWSRFFRRRPLEHLLNGATTLAKSLR
ncbi:hypothetical protein OHB39_26485 [Streptomyces sp. NBC_00047]|uniref:hypothetical protein n=1 Tax=unclassified Streptomyces TaxID=2593676 RepID=UPI00214C43E6|nr:MULTISPECIES: hypothetical protein [unclassified Streptomyces]MCX5611079.1 hypothetical protein [Streptomyces sp. NBC_00047]UUU44941.1 hypothetical protein JIW86_09315 [Streptomyces sp. NBC_00162]